MALERDDGGREPIGNERIRCARATLIGIGNVVRVCPRRDFRSFNKQKHSRSGVSFANLGRSLACDFELSHLQKNPFSQVAKGSSGSGQR